MATILRDALTVIPNHNISEINNAIHHKVFPRNLETCTNLFGRPCPYLKLCYDNKMDGLVQLEKE